MSASPSEPQTENWSSRLTFIMASVGFAVGLGNIWRFPYIVGENGGGAFVLIYLACAFGIGVPLVMSEWAIGRRASHAASASGSFRELAIEQGKSTHWGQVGGVAVIAVFMLMLFYTTIAGWTLDYFVRAISGSFTGIDATGSKAVYDGLLESPWRMAFWHSIVVLLTVLIIRRGIHAGIEKAVNVLIPCLFICLMVMVVYGASVGKIGAALSFLFTPDFSQISGETVLIALGQAFFSIGVAMATMVTYGSYLPRSISIPKNACIVVAADTGVALLAGIAIFPLVFAYGLEPEAGPGLVFQTLPIVFGGLPGGQVFAGIFFLLLIAATITSCIGNFEPVVAWTAERRNG
jgi:neurotransmitter:Na+ symporter, NSS family